MLEKLQKKTFKREVASALLIFWFILTWKLWHQTDPEIVEALTPAHASITPMILLFAAAAFGVDAAVKYLQGRTP